MYKKQKVAVTLPEFDEHFNHDPAELTEISEEVFLATLTHFDWEYTDSRQVNKQANLPKDRGRLHDLDLWINSAWGITVGIAIVKTKGVFSYAKFGDWEIYEKKFRMQFVNDRS